MKILVYGAGVLGGYLTHVLARGGNEVTVLARGERLRQLRENGLVIRHYVQCKTTIDRVSVTEVLRPEDVYDLIFVVMQCTHLEAVLPILAANGSTRIVFVGNQVNAEAIQSYVLQHSVVEKQIAFGFQSTGGRMKQGQVVCVRMGGHMELGGLFESLAWRDLIEGAFANTRYKLTYYDNMDAWHKSHIALIMPLAFASYACNGDLRKAATNKQLLNAVLDAMDEGYRVLETLGYPLLPAKEPNFLRTKRRLFYWMLKMVFATPIGRLAISDHASSALGEMSALNRAFDSLKRQAAIATPNWDGLESNLIARGGELAVGGR